MPRAIIAPMLIEPLGAARDIGRINEIAAVLIRHGFGETLRRRGRRDMAGARDRAQQPALGR